MSKERIEYASVIPTDNGAFFVRLFVPSEDAAVRSYAFLTLPEVFACLSEIISDGVEVENHEVGGSE